MLSSSLGSFLLLAFTTIGFAQTPATVAAPALPSDPKALMLLAAQSNGLIGADIKPWHLKATYKVLDADGKATDQGTYEEFWVSPTKFKRITTGSNYAQTDYGTEKGILRFGDSKSLSDQLVKLRNEFVAPMPDPQNVLLSYYEILTGVGSNIRLICEKDSTNYPAFSSLAGKTYCTTADKPILRVTLSAPEKEQFLHNRILRFQDRYIAGDLQQSQDGKPVLSAHLDSLELYDASDATKLEPPSDMAPVATLPMPSQSPQIGKVNISAGVAVGLLVKKVNPVYPAIAQAAHVSGTVVLQAVIDKQGLVKDIRVISGPAMLQQAALDAVKHWVYRPYMLFNSPVEVATTINVIFQISQISPAMPPMNWPMGHP